MGGPLRRRHLVDAPLDEQGDLAPGLDADADTGVVSGTVTAIGFHRTYLRVTDALGQTDGAPYAFSWSRESCQYGAICGDSTWHLDGATGVIEHDAVPYDWMFWDLGHRTHRVTVTDAMSTTATFDVVFNEL